MQSLICYKTMPYWNSRTLPEAFKQKHNTQEGTWAKLTITHGSLDFAMLAENGAVIETYTFSVDNQPPFIDPQAWHRIVACSDDLECQLAFYCQPELYYHKKHSMTPTHSEVINATRYINSGKALDLGCGVGRNSLYLNLLGFDVTSYDKNSQSIDSLNNMIREESLQNITADIFNINEDRIEDNYDLILSTVVFMFLDKNQVPIIISNMQDKTNKGGYNLIVAAMSTEDYPCSMPFSFTFKENELNDYYAGWDVIKYNQDIGQLHKTDAEGNRIKLRFATLLAKKPE